MLAFGAGTLPMLLAMGSAANFLLNLARSPVFRKAAGASVILFGIYTCFVAMTGNKQDHDHTHHAEMSSNMPVYSQPTLN